MRVLILCLVMIFLSACAACVRYPDRPYNAKTGKWADPPECFDWAVCEYTRTQIKGAGDCKAEFLTCAKARAFIRCMDAETRKAISENPAFPKPFGDCMNALR